MRWEGRRRVRVLLLVDKGQGARTTAVAPEPATRASHEFAAGRIRQRLWIPEAPQ